MEKTTLYLPRDLAQRLKVVSRQTGQSQAEIIRLALTEFLQRQGRPPLRSLGAGESDSIQGEDAEVWLARNWRPR